MGAGEARCINGKAVEVVADTVVTLTLAVATAVVDDDDNYLYDTKKPVIAPRTITINLRLQYLPLFLPLSLPYHKPCQHMPPSALGYRWGSGHQWGFSKQVQKLSTSTEGEERRIKACISSY